MASPNEVFILSLAMQLLKIKIFWLLWQIVLYLDWAAVKLTQQEVVRLHPNNFLLF